MAERVQLCGFARRSGRLWVHGLALLLCAATLVLLLFGGLVTTTGAALAVPDWPTTFGYNMFLYPWAKMVGGIFYEHSHRLVGSVVGLLTIAVALALWVAEPRRWVRWLGLLALLLVTVQGLLGGFRVLFRRETLAVLHGSLAPVFFALTACLALVTSLTWAEEPRVARSAGDVPLKWLALSTTGLLFLQIVLGALLTHLGRQLEGHLLGAVVLTALIPALALRALKHDSDHPWLGRLGLWLAGLLAIQLALGVGAYLYRFTGVPIALGEIWGLAIPVAHRLAGALLVAVSLVFTLQVFRLLGAPLASTSGRAVLSE
ncbi:MAG: COX15/CtaA family protein [Candidatus Methylomirabilia bacterium]